MTKNIYIVTRNFPPMNIVGALRPFRLAKHISKQGWNVNIITLSPPKNLALDQTLLDELGENVRICYADNLFRRGKFIPVKDLIGQQTGSETRPDRKHNRPAILKFINKIWAISVLKFKQTIQPDADVIWVIPIVMKFLFSIKKQETNVLLTTSPPHSLHIVGLILRKFLKIAWVVDYRDPWDRYPVYGDYEINGALNRYVERKIALHADAVISTTETSNDILMDRHHDVSRAKFHVVTNSYDEGKVSIAYQESTTHFVISYTGIFYPEKDPYTFFRALRSWFDSMDKEALNKYENVLKIQLIGSENKITRETIQKLELNNVIQFIPRVSHDEAIRLTRNSDMVLISSGLGGKTRPGWLPSKLFEYLGCRKPILAVVREGEMAGVIRRTNAGYVVTSEDHKAIQEILEMEIEYKFGQQKTTKKFTFDQTDIYEEKNVFNKMGDIINNVLQNRAV